MIYFFEFKGKLYEADDPIELAVQIYEMADKDEELLEKVLKAIADKMVEEIEEEKPQQLDPYEEAFNRQFDEALDKLKDLKLNLD